MCVLWVSIYLCFYKFRLYFGTAPTVWYIYIYIFYYIRSENIIIKTVLLEAIIIKTVLLEASVFEKKDVLAFLSSFPVFFIVRSLKLRKEKIFAYTIFVNTMLKQEVKEMIIISCKVLFSGPPPMKLTVTI